MVHVVRVFRAEGGDLADKQCCITRNLTSEAFLLLPAVGAGIPFRWCLGSYIFVPPAEVQFQC
jgi:hypothetical protein